MMRIARLFTATLLLAGCALMPGSRPAEKASPEALKCLELLQGIDEEVRAAGVGDAQSAGVSGYPYLRVDRLLASFNAANLDPKAFAAWLDQLQALDLDGRRAEIANLPKPARERLAGKFVLVSDGTRAVTNRAEECGMVLRNELVDSKPLRAEFASRAQVPDDYVDWQRVVGLYPLTQLVFASGVRGWQDDTMRVFRLQPDALQPKGTLMRYAPPSAPAATPGDTAAVLAHIPRGPLGVPEPAEKDVQRLFLAYAPVFIVDTATDDDRIGTAAVLPGGSVEVRVAPPIVYTYISHARWQGAIVLQLNYVIWFPARPSDGTFDLLAGHVDGLTWRITLAPNGEALVADTIHNCGCYHLFFPSSEVVARTGDGAIEERPFFPQPLPELRAGQRYALRIASRAHYIERVLAVSVTEGGRVYDLQSYDALRSITLGHGARRSFFAPDGIVPGTERAERFLFWPMGVPDPGAMRIRGRHATAFVGRRHFDDPWLIERNFAPASAAPAR